MIDLRLNDGNGLRGSKRNTKNKKRQQNSNANWIWKYTYCGCCELRREQLIIFQNLADADDCRKCTFSFA